MKKKQYVKPAQRIVVLQHQSNLLQYSGKQVQSLGSGSPFEDIDSDEDYEGPVR